MKRIFEPITINGKLALKNRIARSATVDSISFGGHITPQVCEIYRNLAQGNVGMIVTGQTAVSIRGRNSPDQMTAFHNEFTKELAVLVAEVHKAGGKIIVQLNHCGLKARMYDVVQGPSEFPAAPGVKTNEMTTEEILSVVEDFAKAAKKCIDAGADGVQLHNSHGYLLSSFFSPYTNRRADDYGGNRENRARLVFEVYDAVREAVSSEYVIGMKANLSDMVEPSVTAEDVIWLCQKLEEKGLDFLEFTCGLFPGALPPSRFLSPPKHDDDPPFFRDTALIAEHLNIPVFGVDGYRSPEIIERCLNESRLAGISMCRPFIREPGLLLRWETGDRTPAECTSCHACAALTKWIQRCEEKPSVVEHAKWFGCPVKMNCPRTKSLT